MKRDLRRDILSLGGVGVGGASAVIGALALGGWAVLALCGLLLAWASWNYGTYERLTSPPPLYGDADPADDGRMEIVPERGPDTT